MFWKIYFRLLVLVVVIGIAGGLAGVQGFPVRGPIMMIGSVLTLIALAGLFAYAWKRQVLSRRFWQVFVPLYLVWEAGSTVIGSDGAAMRGNLPEAILAVGLTLPWVWALVRLAFANPKAPRAVEADRTVAPAT